VIRPFTWLLILSSSVLLVASCAAPEPPASPFRPTASVRDVMHAMIEPQAYVIWNSVAEIIDINGTELRVPETEEEWDVVRHGAVALREATNLLLIEGRPVAYPGETSVAPGIELEPEQIQALIDADPQGWIDSVHGLYDAVEPIFAAIDAQDGAAITEAGTQLDVVCENCHVKYWYPEEMPEALEGQ
jgi:hypothetical protein